MGVDEEFCGAIRDYIIYLMSQDFTQYHIDKIEDRLANDLSVRSGPRRRALKRELRGLEKRKKGKARRLEEALRQ